MAPDTVEAPERLHWHETPRMRWRAAGVAAYARVVLRGTLLYGVILAVLGGGVWLRAATARQGQRAETFGMLVGLGAAARLLLEMLPATVRLSRRGIAHEGGVLRRWWSMAEVKAIRRTAVRGVLRLDLDVNRRVRGKSVTRHVIIAAPAALADRIEAILSAPDPAPVPVLPAAGPVPLRYERARASALGALFPLGVVMVMFSIELFAIVILVVTGRFRHVWVRMPPKVLGFLAAAGVIAIVVGIVGCYCVWLGHLGLEQVRRLRMADDGARASERGRSRRT